MVPALAESCMDFMDVCGAAKAPLATARVAVVAISISFMGSSIARYCCSEGQPGGARVVRSTSLDRAAAPRRRVLAKSAWLVHIGGGRLAVDVPLANRVRSGRKQP